jgi:truncated hemoglobin YjbI
MTKPNNTNLLSKLNGWATTQKTTAGKVLKKALDRFYSRALNDSQLSRFFEDVDVATLKKSQYSFMEKLFGNEEINDYTSGKMIKAHLDLIQNRGSVQSTLTISWKIS